MHLVDIHTHQDLPEEIYGIRNIRYPEEPCDSAYSIGIHPWDSKTVVWDNHIETLAEKAIAIGECGIDKCAKIDLYTQKALFEKHIELAQRFHKPLIIHCVQAYGTILELSQKYTQHTPWLIHGCYASTEWIRQASRQNIYFSVGPSQMHLKRFAEVLKNIPQDKLLLETDDSGWMINDVYKALNVKAEDIWNNYLCFIGQITL